MTIPSTPASPRDSITLAELSYENTPKSTPATTPAVTPGTTPWSSTVKLNDTKGISEADLVDQTLYLPASKVSLIVIAISLCFFLAILEQTIVALAVPAIASHFRAGTKVSWIVTAFFLGSCGISPLIGRFSDIFSRKAVLLASTGVFFFSTLACAFAGSIEQLIVFRAIQGIGAAGINTTGIIVLADVVPLGKRGKYQGIIDAICSTAQATGPLLGAILVDKLGWRSCFWILLPLIAIDAVLLWWLIPVKEMKGDWRAKLGAIDYVGCLLSLTGTVLLLVAILRGGVEAAWSSAAIITPLVLAILCFIAFGVWELKFAHIPLIPLRLFSISTVTAVHLSTLAHSAANFIILYEVPVFLQVVRGLSLILSGAVILPYGTGMSIMVCASVMLANKTGLRPLIIGGLILWTVMGGLLTMFTDTTPIGKICGILAFGSIGAGFVIMTNLMALQAAVPRPDVSVITGSRLYMRQLGSAIGVAVAASIVSNGLSGRLTSLGLPSSLIRDILDDPPSIQGSLKQSLDIETVKTIIKAYVESYRSVFWVVFGLLAFSLVISVVLLKEHPLVREDDKEQKEAKMWLEEQKNKKKSVKVAKEVDIDNEKA